MTHDSRLTTVFAEPLGSQAALRMGRVDHLLRTDRYVKALEEMGRLPKSLHDDPTFQRYLNRAFAGLYGPTRKKKRKALRTAAPSQGRHQIRVTRRRQDANANSDQDFDNRGWQINQLSEAVLEGKNGLKGRFVLALDGFKNGHNDLRYRKLLADFFKGSSHFAFGDVSTYRNEYFLRGSNMRGVNLLLEGDTHQFHALFGAYPFWLEDRDQYIYPRTVLGLYDRWRLPNGRVRAGFGFVQTRDSEKIRTINLANQPRDNLVFSMDQEIQIIPKVWMLNAAESYSVTDDNLIEDRFGDTRKLKDTAFKVESRLIQPWGRLINRFYRTGPDYRLLTDVASGSVTSVKTLTSDRQFMQHLLDLNPIGFIDLDLEFSSYRNDLDDDDTVEHTRERWTSVNLGFLLPAGWPRPRIRGNFIETVSSPGSTTRPSQTRTVDLRAELAHKWMGLRLSEFATYRAEHPAKDRLIFDEEERWGAGARISASLGNRIHASTRYRYEFFDELFNETRHRGIRHEANLSGSFRIWSTASVGLSYSFLHGKLIDPNPTGTNLLHARQNIGSVNFTWPYQRLSPDNRRKLTFSPALYFYLSDFDQDLQLRPSATGRLRLGYEVFENWRVELAGEFHYNKDDNNFNVRNEESRLWLLVESKWK